MSANPLKPTTVSIIMPTYNRAAFLPQAFSSIKEQQFQDWELIVIDDGSIDNTEEVVVSEASKCRQPVHFVKRQNGGPAVARNAGLKLAKNEFIAFFDSDDLWLPHHLERCVTGLLQNPEVDWIFTSSRGVSLNDGQEQWASSFYRDGIPRAFLQLSNKEHGSVHVLTDSRTFEVALLDGFEAGFQVSVFRSRVFESLQIPDQRIGEDQVFLLQAIAAGMTLAYINDVHLIYRVHPGNVSLASKKTVPERVALLLAMIGGFEKLQQQLKLTPSQQQALRHRLASEYCWNAAYPLAQAGRYAEALPLFRKGLQYSKWNPGLWKTYALMRLRRLAQCAGIIG